MPNNDKTGPKGEGPKTGRGLGSCENAAPTDCRRESGVERGRACGRERGRGMGCGRGLGRNQDAKSEETKTN